jgi:hypothetical protein
MNIGDNNSLYHMLWGQMSIHSHMNYATRLVILNNLTFNKDAWSQGFSGSTYVGRLYNQIGICCPSSGTKITSLNFFSTQSGGLGAGSRFRIWSIGRAGIPVVTVA